MRVVVNHDFRLVIPFRHRDGIIEIVRHMFQILEPGSKKDAVVDHMILGGFRRLNRTEAKLARQDVRNPAIKGDSGTDLPYSRDLSPARNIKVFHPPAGMRETLHAAKETDLQRGRVDDLHAKTQGVARWSSRSVPNS